MSQQHWGSVEARWSRCFFLKWNYTAEALKATADVPEICKQKPIPWLLNSNWTKFLLSELFSQYWVVVETPESRYLATFQVFFVAGFGLEKGRSWNAHKNWVASVAELGEEFTIPLIGDNNQTPKFFLPREWQILQSLRVHCDTQPSFQKAPSQ